MHMTPAAKPAWDRLAEALMETSPDCEGDDRYITDINTADDKRVMWEMCSACPLLALCVDYASSDRPKGGWWPGHNLKPSTRKEAA